MKSLLFTLLLSLCVYTQMSYAQTFTFPKFKSADYCHDGNFTLNASIEVVGIKVKNIYYDNPSTDEGSFGFEVVLKYSNNFEGILPTSATNFWKYQIFLYSKNPKIAPKHCTNNLSTVPIASHNSDTFDLKNSNTYNGSATRLGLKANTVYTDRSIVEHFGFDSAQLEVLLPCLSLLSNNVPGSFIVNPMSIDILDFTAKNIDNKAVLLTWNTSADAEGSTQIVERSTDGIHWTAIYSVPSVNHPTNNSATFSYVDKSPIVGKTAYYRIKIIHEDAIQYSKVNTVLLTAMNTNIITVAPNPAINQITFMYLPSNAVLYIYDIHGAQVQQLSMPQAGNLQVDLVNYPSGVYVYKCYVAGQLIISDKFVKY